MATRNVTLSLDEALARWARVRAAERDMSLSRFLAELLRERMEHERNYAAAMRRALSLKPRDLSGGRAYPAREELHDRTGLR